MNANTHQATANGKPSPTLTHEQVSCVAYHLYLENGDQDGRDQEDWFRAERLIMESSALASRNPDDKLARPEAVNFLNTREASASDLRHHTHGQDEVRRRRISPASRQSPRLPERSGQTRFLQAR